MDALHRNFLQSLRAQVAWSVSAELHEAGGVLATSASPRLPLGTFNAAARLDPGLSARAFLDEVGAYFAARRRGFTIFLPGEGDADVETEALARGLMKLEDLHVLATRTAVPARRAPAELVIDPIRDAAGLARFSTVMQACYAIPPLSRELIAATFASAARVFAPELSLAIARVGDADRGAALVLHHAGVAGMYWLATMPEARNTGVAASLIRALVDQAFARGAGAVVVQAARAVAPLYERLGFELEGRVRRLTWPFTRKA